LKILNPKNSFLKGISFSYLYISVYLITGILTTPLLLNYFKADYFALLMLIYGVITYLNNIRFGLPESLAVLLAQSKDITYNTYIVKKTFFILSLIALFVLFFLFIVGIIINDWSIILGDIYNLNKENTVVALYLFVIFALLKIPFDISLATFIGFHEVYWEKIYKIINPLVNFALVLFVVYTEQNILFFAFWAGLLDLTVSLISFIHMCIRYNILNTTNLAKAIPSSYLLKNGILFFQLSIIQTLTWGIGIFIVSHMLSLEDVTSYSINIKIYIYLFYAYVIINTVVAPLYGKKISTNSWREIKKIFNTMLLLLPFFGGYIWIGTLYFMSELITIWTNSHEFYIGSIFVLFMGAYFYFAGYINSYVTLLYSIGKIKSILYIQWKEVIINIVITILTINFIGLNAIALGMFISILFISIYNMSTHLKSTTKGKISLDLKIQKKHFTSILIPNVLIAFIITNLTDQFLLKLAFFSISSFLYIIFSWAILSKKQKVSLLALLNYRKNKLP
jgi:O-antigen/teichoic acid export membrane protein